MPDGSVKHVHVVAHAVSNHGDQLEFIGALMDVTAAKQAEEELHKTQTELARVTRVTTLGELGASLAPEVDQPLAAVVTNAEACVRWLDRETPDLDEARSAVKQIVNDGHRASEVIRRLRALVNHVERHRHGTVDLPVDHRGTWGTDVGHQQCRAGCDVSVHSAIASRGSKRT